jgi:hypothetical protein
MDVLRYSAENAKAFQEETMFSPRTELLQISSKRIPQSERLDFQ